MSVTITVTFTDREAEAVLKSEGLTNGHGVRKSVALSAAEMKLIGTIQAGWNTNINVKEANS